MEPKFRFLSWGCGVQSTCLGEMSAIGELPKLDAIVTSDTGWERKKTYEIRDWYADRWRKMGLRVYIVSNGNIHNEAFARRSHIPAFTLEGTPINRECTEYFKLRPTKRKMREIAGYHSTKPPHPKPGEFEVWLGISLDEWQRAIDRKTGQPKKGHAKFEQLRWPLLELKMGREDCKDWFREHNLPVPIQSACICCPHRSASHWLEMRETAPDEFADAVQFDYENRHNIPPKLDADALYIYRHGGALGDSDLEGDAERERRKFGIQMPLMCESGLCWT